MSASIPSPQTFPEQFDFWSALASRAEAVLNEHVCHRALQCMEIWGGSHSANTDVATPGLEAWVYSRPYEGAKDGGDVHYVSLCGGGLITRFILADVAGHGAKVAELAKSLRNLMRQNINRKSHARLVTSLNSEFTELDQQGRFATAVIATYLADKDRLTVSNAGHPPPLIYRAAERKWSFLADDKAAANLPLGIDRTQTFSQTEIPLQRGDLALLYTDGLTELRNPAGELLAGAGLLSFVEKLNAEQPANVAAGLIRKLDDFRDEKPADDDVTFLLLHHNGSRPPRLTIGQKLDVYAKVFRLKPV